MRVQLSLAFCFLGYIYDEDIKNAFPNTNKIDIVDLRGDVLLEVLEKSASFYNKEKPNGAFLQVSGNQLSNVIHVFIELFHTCIT